MEIEILLIEERDSFSSLKALCFMFSLQRSESSGLNFLRLVHYRYADLMSLFVANILFSTNVQYQCI